MVFNISTLGSLKFKSSNVFFIDTNVILKLHHPPSSRVDPIRAGVYSNFITTLRKQGCSLCISSFNVQEAFYVVETIAYNTYKDSSSSDIKRKDFRKKYRSAIGGEESSLWNQLKENYIIENAVISREMLEAFIVSYNRQCYDPIDFLFTENHPECAVITSDPDFIQDPLLSVFTC